MQLRWRKGEMRTELSLRNHTEGGSSKYISTDITEHTSTCGLNWLYLEGSVPVVNSRVIAR
jgi:hypothetical protein